MKHISAIPLDTSEVAHKAMLPRAFSPLLVAEVSQKPGTIILSYVPKPLASDELKLYHLYVISYLSAVLDDWTHLGSVMLQSDRPVHLYLGKPVEDNNVQ